MFLLQLRVGWAEAALVLVLQLLRGGVEPDAALAAIIGDAVDGDVVHHVALIHVGDVRAAEIIDGTVVEELVVLPVAALVAAAGIAVAVIHAAIEADMRAPIAGMPHVIAARSPGPVARYPDIAGRGDGRLLIDRQDGRGDGDGGPHHDLGVGGRWHEGDGGSGQPEHEWGGETHLAHSSLLLVAFFRAWPCRACTC